MSTETHPSFFALDEAALGTANQEVYHHLKNCERCQSHLARVRQSHPFPGDLRVRAEARGRFTFASFFPRPLLVGLATACAVGVWVASVSESEHSEREQHSASTLVRVKGVPSFGIYLKHGGEVTLWDGVRPVSSDDQLRVKVTPEGFTYLTALNEDAASKRPVPLYSARLAAKEGTLLDESWRFDDSPGQQVLWLVLTHKKPSQEELEGFIARSTRNIDAWVTRFTFAKAPPPSSSGGRP